MKSGWMKGMFAGAVVGASAAVMAGMMNRQTQKRMIRKVCGCAHKMADKAETVLK